MTDAVRSGKRRRRRRSAWTSASSKPCSRSPRRGRSPPPPTASTPCSRTSPSQVRQLEAELGVQLLVRGRRGAVPTEFGVRVLDRARRDPQRARARCARTCRCSRASRPGTRRSGVVGTVEPLARARARRRAARASRRASSLRLNEGASERLAVEVADRELAQRGRHRAGRATRGSSSSTCATKRSSGSCPPALELARRSRCRSRRSPSIR